MNYKDSKDSCISKDSIENPKSFGIVGIQIIKIVKNIYKILNKKNGSLRILGIPKILKIPMILNETYEITGIN